MTECHRFESEGLTRFVANQPLDSHFDSCADCRAARASYQAVATALEQARDAYAPPGDWEARVWARVQRGEGARRLPRWTGLAAIFVPAAAAAVFFFTSARQPDALMLATNEVEQGSARVVRKAVGRIGESAVPGDVQTAVPGNILHLAIKVPRGKVGDLRVYRGTNELVFQCATSPACIRTEDGMAARVTLERTGTYRTLLIAADKALPAATGDLDADYAAALRAGTAKQSAPIDVL